MTAIGKILKRSLREEDQISSASPPHTDTPQQSEYVPGQSLKG